MEEIEIELPATVVEGARNSGVCAWQMPAIQSMIDAASKPQLRLGEAVLIDHDMKVLNLSCERFWNLN